MIQHRDRALLHRHHELLQALEKTFPVITTNAKDAGLLAAFVGAVAERKARNGTYRPGWFAAVDTELAIHADPKVRPNVKGVVARRPLEPGERLEQLMLRADRHART